MAVARARRVSRSRTLLVIGAVLAMVSCTPSASRPGADTVTAGTQTSTGTGARTGTQASPTASSEVPHALHLTMIDAASRPPDEPLPTGEVEGSCPYIKAGLNIEAEASGDNFADLEGNRVQRVIRLTTLVPIGCRFYFQRDYHPTGDILPTRYASATEAYNAMVLTARAGTSGQGVPAFVPGVDGISFRTRLYAPDAGQDWAFASAKGEVMVVVRTDQTRTQSDAVNISKAIVGEFS